MIVPYSLAGTSNLSSSLKASYLTADTESKRAAAAGMGLQPHCQLSLEAGTDVLPSMQYEALFWGHHNSVAVCVTCLAVDGVGVWRPHFAGVGQP